MDDSFTIQQILDSGQGVVATRALKQGEVILEEPPLVTQQYQITAQSLAPALSCLSRHDQIRFLSLSNAWSKSDHHPLVGIWLTNALPCGTPEDPTGERTEIEGIFPIAARFNGSCTPNVYHWWDDVAQRLVLRAARDVDPGEELCIAYVNILAPRADRRVSLEKYYNYLCACEACSLRGQELRDSDRRRRQIARIRAEEAEYLDPAFGLHKIKLAIRLLREEELLEYSGVAFYFSGFDFCAMAGDAESARAWAWKAHGALCMIKDPDSSSTKYWKSLAESPGGAHNFGSGKKYRLTGPDL